MALNVTPSSTLNPLLANPNSTSNTSSSSNIVNSTIPGAEDLTNSAVTNTGNLLNGMPATSAARRAAAYFGTGSGAPSSDFTRNRGFDLYSEQANQNKQQGLSDYLALISGLTGPQLQQQSQNNQSSQFAQQLAQQRQQYADSLKQRQEEFNASNDLALQQFGFQRDRYYSGLPQKKTNGIQVSNPDNASGFFL